MKDGVKISLACLLFLFVSYCASPIQAQYVRDVPPDPVKVFVDNGNGEVQIVFKWEKSGETPPAGLKITCKITDAVGSFNTINAKDISFAWEEGPCLAPTTTNLSTPVAEATPTPAPILIGRLKVAGLHDFNDFSAPYTGYVVFFSETANVAPTSLKFQLHRKPITSIASYLENITLPGTNFVPSFLSPLFPGLLYVGLGILFLFRGKLGDKKWLLIFVAVIILGVGALIGLSRNPGPKYSSVYIDSPQLTQGRNDQTAVPAKEIGILTSDKSGWGKMYLEKRNGEYYLTFRELPRAGEYNGKIPADFISTPAIPVKVRVADWVLYFFVTVLGGILAAQFMKTSIRSLPEFNEAMVIAGGSVLTVLVTHFALYTDTWGSNLDYVKAFAAGAGVSFVSKSALALASRIAQRSSREVEAP